MLEFLLFWIEIFVGLFFDFEGFDVFLVFDFICDKVKIIDFGFDRFWLLGFVFINWLVFKLDVELRKVFDFCMEVFLLYGIGFKNLLFIGFCFDLVFEIIFLFELNNFGLLLINGVEEGMLIDEEWEILILLFDMSVEIKVIFIIIIVLEEEFDMIIKFKNKLLIN